VRIRESGEVKKMKIEEFIKMIKKEMVGKPFRNLSLPKFLTKRPKFVAST